MPVPPAANCRLFHLVFGVLLAGAALALAACSPKPEPFGDHGVTTYWAWGEVSTNLPPPWDQKTTAVAAEDAMRSKGYIIEGRTSLDAAPCRIFGRPGRGDATEETIVTVSSSGGGTRIAIFVRPTGDEGESKAILRGILARLGLYGRNDQRSANAAY
ncbi:MAG: hypothetical protein ACREJO_11055 [Phycisphaerales bacterium]